MDPTLKNLKEEIEKVYLIVDKYVIDVLLACLISNRLTLSDKPVWLLLIGPSSGGKTALLQLLDKAGSWLIPLDTLTTNTFASGFQGKDETSLLQRANGGVLVFKDFTTLTAMNEDGLREIMGQLRAIYDGSFNKKTGGIKSELDWNGKIGIIGGGTVAVQRKLRQYSEQGERFINYVMIQPDRQEMTLRAINNQKGIKAKEEYLQHLTSEFINHVLEKAFTQEIEIDEDFKKNMVSVADFCTLARSPVIFNKKTGKVEWVPDPEMPSRMATMLTNIGVTLGIMNEDGLISEDNMKAVYKIAFDSIPANRRLLMQLLTKHGSASSRNMAIKLNYPTDTVVMWCSELNALKIIDRKSSSGGIKGDLWEMKENYREVMQKFEGLELGYDELIVSDEEESGYSDEELINPTDEQILNDIDWGDFADPPSKDIEEYNQSNLEF